MKRTYAWIGFLMAALLAASCAPGIPVTGADTSTPTLVTEISGSEATISALETQVAATLTPLAAAASQGLTPVIQRAVTSAASETLSPGRAVTATFTANASFTPSAVLMMTPVPSATPRPSATPASVIPPCNLAAFVSDVTIPNGTFINANTSFVKTWRLRNVGSCTWSANYRVVFVRGDTLGGSTSAAVGAAVAPGQTVDLSLTLTTPATTGTYEGFYKLEDASGNIFGVGGDGNGAFDVLILDGVTQNQPFAVIHVTFGVNSPMVTVACPPGNTFAFSADIVVNGAGTVKYHWIFSDGTTTPVQSIVFSSAGDQLVNGTWTLGANGMLPSNPYAGTANLYIGYPNNQTFSGQSIAISCIFATPTASRTPTRTATPTPTRTPRPSATPTH